MKKLMSREQIEDLLDIVLEVPKRNSWKGDRIQFCCPVHGETHPSCGINIDYCPPNEVGVHLQVFHCFSCDAGGTIPWLLFRSLPDRFRSVKQAEDFLKKRYGVDFSKTQRDLAEVKRYEDFYKEHLIAVREELPRTKLAPFRSGKETYQYFLDRGFDMNDVQKFMIGRDLESETVTIPAFWEDGVLAGFIGRYIDPNRRKNERYKIYNFSKGSMIYPLDKLIVSNDTIIGVESMLDVIMLHKWGITNAVALMGNSMTNEQARQITSRCKKFIALFDRDEGGETATKIARKKLKGAVMFLCPTYYPEEGKDPSEWGEIETLRIINSARIMGAKTVPRL